MENIMNDKTATCQICSEAIFSTDAWHWFHVNGTDEYCGTGDGATAWPSD